MSANGELSVAPFQSLPIIQTVQMFELGSPTLEWGTMKHDMLPKLGLHASNFLQQQIQEEMI